MKTILGIFLALFLYCTPAQAAYTFYRSVTIDHTKVPSTQANFPVYVTATLNTSHVLNASGFDIRAYLNSACTSSVNYSLQYYNSSTGVVYMRVLIASLSSSVDTVIYLCFGDAALSSNGSSTATFNSDYKLFVTAPNGTSLTVSDTSQGGQTVTNHSATATAGQVDGAASFNGSSTSFSVADFYIGDARTYSFWINPVAVPSMGTFAVIMGKRLASNEALIYYNDAGSLVAGVWDTLNSLMCAISTSSPLALNTWTKIDFTWPGYDPLTPKSCNLYVSSVLDATEVSMGASGINDGTADYYFGQEGDGSAFFNGKIDEDRMEAIGRDQDWLTIEFNNENSPGTFLTIGTETAVGGGGSACKSAALLLGVGGC